MRKARFGAASVVTLSVLALTPTAHARDEALKGDRNLDHERFRTKQHGAIELRGGPYRPDVDAEFGGAATPFQDLYGTGDTVMFGIEADWQALRIPHFGTLGPGFQASFATFSAYSLLEADPTQRSAQPTNMWFLPMSVLAVLRVDVLARDLHIPFVPYVKFGGTLTLWEATDGLGVSVVNGVAGQGVSTGLTGAAGLMFLLNALAPQRGIDMDNATGVNNAYVFGEWMVSRVSSFDEGLETGDSTWQVGVALEF